MSSTADRRWKILDGISAAAKLAGRDPADVQLIAVSKGRALEEIEPLIEAGQRDFGENRVQEALAKWPPLLARYPDVRLHEVGRLQSNKAAEAVSAVRRHPFDRPTLAARRAREGGRKGRARAVRLCASEHRRGGAEGRLRDR